MTERPEQPEQPTVDPVPYHPGLEEIFAAAVKDEERQTPAVTVGDDNPIDAVDTADADTEVEAGNTDSEPVPEAEAERARTSRDVLYETIGIELINAGVFVPASEFVDQVREAAGSRVAPRQVATAVSQLARAEYTITPESVVEIISATSGDRSSRQQRHSDDWRSLGATLALQGQDGSPEGQRAFIGMARAIAGPSSNDMLLLRVALALAETGQTLDADLVGKIAKRLARSAADLSPDDYPALVQSELRVVRRARRERTARSHRSSVGSRRQVAAGSNADKPGPRKLRPGNRRGAGVKRSIRRQRDE